MTQPQATAERPKTARTELPKELIDQVDEARGDRPRTEWLAEAIQAKLSDGRDSSEPYVDLDEEPERKTVRFRGTQYELHDLNEFGIREQQRLNRDGREFAKLWASEEELTDDQGERLVLVLNRTFEKILDAPADILDEFSDAERSRVVLAFTYAPARQLAALLQLMQTDAQARDNGSGTTS